MRILLMIALVICLAPSAFAADYYMSPQGNDSNPGTLAAPWRTMDRLQDAVDSVLRPGDTVYFMGGEYRITDDARNKHYSWRADGTPSAPITYKNYGNEKPVILTDRLDASLYRAPGYDYRQPAPNSSLIVNTNIFISGDYVIVDGLTFRQSEASRRLSIIDNTYLVVRHWAITGGVNLYGNHSTLRNCVVDNNAQTPIFYGGNNGLVEYCSMTNNASHGFYISGQNGTFRYNYIDGSRGFGNQEGFQMQYATSKGNKIYGNLVMNGQASGMTMSGGISNNEVFNNVFINPGMKTYAPTTDPNAGAEGGHGWAIFFYCQDAPMGPGNKIYNNTFIGTSTGGLINNGISRLCGGIVPGTQVQIYNNIFYPSPLIRIGLGTSNVRNNIFYNISGSVPPGNSPANPNLVNPTGDTASDAMLQAGSSAIDQATSGAPQLDYRAGTRPVGPAADVGAYEYGAPAGAGGGPLGGGSGGGGDPTFPCI